MSKLLDAVILLIITVALLVAASQYALPRFTQVMQERLVNAANVK